MQKVNQRLVDQMEAEKNSFISEENMMRFLAKSFIVEISKNLKVPKNRRRYSNEFYDFSMLLYTQSPKSYRILRQIYPFPSEYCLRKKYADIIFQISRSLVDFKYSIELLKSIQIKGECTLAIDAFCFKSFSGTSLGLNFKQHYTESTEESILFLENEEEEEEADDITDDENDILTNDSNMETENLDLSQSVNSPGDYSNGFIFLLIPLSSSFPSKIIHIEIAENGSYNEHIDGIANFFKETLRQLNIIPLFHATDGDRGMSPAHEEFFNNFFIKKTTMIHTDFETLISNVYLSSSKK